MKEVLIRSVSNYHDIELSKEKKSKTKVLRNGKEIETYEIQPNDEYLVSRARAEVIVGKNKAIIIDMPKQEETKTKLIKKVVKK
ncbi:MAG: hypothetical protein PHG03_00190 [Bacilli bacterium]|nr:hypothetical protein [Bacilli bacterium]MDD4794970.1 hypothetical protein [Bacilli bacterium]